VNRDLGGTEVISAISAEALVLKLAEDQGAPYLGGAVGVGGDALKGGPALGEQGEPGFSTEAQVAQLYRKVPYRPWGFVGDVALNPALWDFCGDSARRIQRLSEP